MTAFDNWHRYNTCKLTCKKSGSSMIRTSSSQTMSEQGLFMNPETELPDFGKCVEKKLS